MVLSLFRGTTLLLMTFGFLSLVGCGGADSVEGGAAQEDLPAAAQPMSADVQELVNGGNDAQRAGDYQGALGFYREAMALASDHPVPQFGALMAAMALGNTALSDSLTLKLQATSPELLAMLSPEGGMGGGMPEGPHGAGMPDGTPPSGTSGQIEGLPAGHPVLYDLVPDSTRPDTIVSR